MSSGFVIERPLIPVSSSTSRRAVLSMVSLDSAFPFGKSHLPLRKINKIRSDAFKTLPPPAITFGKNFKNVFNILSKSLPIKCTDLYLSFFKTERIFSILTESIKRFLKSVSFST